MSRPFCGTVVTPWRRASIYSHSISLTNPHPGSWLGLLAREVGVCGQVDALVLSTPLLGLGRVGSHVFMLRFEVTNFYGFTSLLQST